jgi:putative transposase
VCIEDLQLKNITKSASGGFENPGSDVKATIGLNKARLDQGCGELKRQFGYKSL